MLQLRGSEWDETIALAAQSAPYVGFVIGIFLLSTGSPMGSMAFTLMVGGFLYYAGLGYVAQQPQRVAQRARRRFLLEKPNAPR